MRGAASFLYISIAVNRSGFRLTRKIRAAAETNRIKRGRGAALSREPSLSETEAGLLVVLKEAGTKEDGEVSLPDITPTCWVVL